MAKRIVTKDKKDIVTGFEITAEFDFFSILSGVRGLASLPDAVRHDLAKESVKQVKPQLDDLVDKAEEIFIEEASVSRWSGNMIDNSVCGISGTMPEVRKNGEALYMDIKVGVNHKEIKNPANWTSRAPIRPRKNAVIYEYGGMRMHQPFVDYSVFLNKGTARIPNAALWANFVRRAEGRFDAL